MPIFSNKGLKRVTDSYHGGGYKQGRQDERERWLPLWEALIKIEQFEDFTASDDFFEYSPEYNAARRNLHRAIQNLKSQGEK
jgi:hypothetical protein